MNSNPQKKTILSSGKRLYSTMSSLPPTFCHTSVFILLPVPDVKIVGRARSCGAKGNDGSEKKREETGGLGDRGKSCLLTVPARAAVFFFASLLRPPPPPPPPIRTGYFIYSPINRSVMLHCILVGVLNLIKVDRWFLLHLRSRSKRSSDCKFGNSCF